MSFIPYAQRPEWSDLPPIPQDDGPNPLVPIAYTEEYRSSMDQFRAVTRKNELSDRALELTWEIIQLNPAHYTVWHYRKNILFAMNKDLSEELDLIDELAEENPKCYQLWHHRQLIVAKLNDGSRELGFIANVLADDSKNYHAWSYRQWVVKKFDLWKNELAYIDSLIDIDVRNNSAWNQRYFVVRWGPEGCTEDVIKREIQYAITKIAMAQNNESPWNYLSGIAQITGIQSHPEIEVFCRDLLESSTTNSPQGRISPFLLACLVDICEDRLNRGDGGSASEAGKFCKMLETKHDVIRAKYWARRKEAVEALGS